MRLLIVDDHEIVREGLLLTLASNDAFEIVGTAGTGAEALMLAKRTLPELALVDLRLPDMPGEEVCQRLTTMVPGIAVIVLSTYLSEEAVRSALSAGAAGYVTKAAGLGKLRETIEEVTVAPNGQPRPQASQIVKQLHELVARRMEATTLTPQQELVLELAAEGLTNRKIGERVFISESTVRYHLQRLKEAFDAKTKTELIAKAIRAGAIVCSDEDVATTR